MTQATETEMDLQAFFLADHAEAVNGKLYVTGGCWNRITATKLPVPHGHLSVAIAINVPWTETNEKHTLELELVDDDGNLKLPKVEGEFEVGRAPGLVKGQNQVVVMTFAIDALTIEKAGSYNFRLSVDGKLLGRAPFIVQLDQPKSQTA